MPTLEDTWYTYDDAFLDEQDALEGSCYDDEDWMAREAGERDKHEWRPKFHSFDPETMNYSDYCSGYNKAEPIVEDYGDSCYDPYEHGLGVRLVNFRSKTV